MATTITIPLEALHHLRARIDRHRLEEQDWVVIGALVSSKIARTQAQLSRLAAKANQQAAEQQQAKEPEAGLDLDAQSASHTGDVAPTGDCGERILPGELKDDTAAEGDKPSGGRKGHGRNGADAFTSATKQSHTLDAGIIGAVCKACGMGRVSPYRDKVIIQVIGQPIFGAIRHHFEQGRCRLCGASITAEGVEFVLEQGIGTSYVIYDWSACAMLIVMHYFAGAPFKRLEALHQGWGVPMPDANQWRIADAGDDLLAPLSKALEKHGIQNATTLIFDDTGSMIIDVRRAIHNELQTLALLGESTKGVRTGINATGVHLETEEGKVILFFTGRHHAGEIIDRLLAHRKAKTNKLVSVTDAASKNFSHDQTDQLEEAVCNAHCYLKFRAVKDQFPAEHAVAGEIYEQVFDYDDRAKALGLNPDERMHYHRTHSMPLMQRLWQMCKDKLDNNLVEPNSPLWEPVSFVINQWRRLTKFCEVAGVPLHTNTVEQTLIIPVRYLAGSFAYKTQNGADVGDRHMSLVASANANGLEPVAYLTDCLRNHEDLAKRPEHYLPWVYRDRLEQEQLNGAKQHQNQTPPPSNPSPMEQVRHPLRPGRHRDDSWIRARAANSAGTAPGCSAGQ